jgi:CRP-like cAMP-binding protein
MVKPQLLSKLDLFRGLTPEELEMLAGLFHPERYAAQQVIFRQGDRAEKLHILLTGEIEILLQPYDGEKLLVATISPGGIFGWSAALGRRQYTSDAVAVVEGEGLSIRGKALRSFCQAHPQSGVVLLERLAEVISSRLRNTHHKVFELLQSNLHPESAPRA